MDLTLSIPLAEVKRHDPLGLPREVMQMVGPAAQTFGALRTFARNTGETFASIAAIAEKACLPKGTVKRHLTTLCEAKLIKHKGRQRRRTATYFVALAFLGGNDGAKFAILPRWAATMLPTWAERAVFALVVSRDCLNEVITDGAADGDDVYNRLQYPVTTLAKDSGLAFRSISIAKAKLVKRGLLTIDPAAWWRDDHGRCRTMADTLYLKADFHVPGELIHRSAKVSHDRTAEMGNSNGSDTLHRGLLLDQTQRKNEPDPAQKWATPSANVSRLRNGSLNGTLNRTLYRTAEPPKAAASAAFSEVDLKKAEGEETNATDLKEIDQEARRAALSERLRAIQAADEVH